MNMTAIIAVLCLGENSTRGYNCAGKIACRRSAIACTSLGFRMLSSKDCMRCRYAPRNLVAIVMQDPMQSG